MKKQIGLFTAILFAVSTLMVGCKAEVHTHTFAEEWSSDETNHWHASTCGHEVTEGKTAHTIGDWTTTKEATCTEDGSKTGVCEVCKKEVTEKIDAKGHSLDIWTTTKEPTCTEEGSKTGVCEVCKKDVTEKIDVKGHSYSESWKKDASGHWKECACGAKDEAEHNFGIWKVTTDPTDTTEGTSKRVCDICNFEETKQIIPIPEGFVLVEAGTFQMGSIVYGDNKPVHKVTITKPFYMGKCEVTQEEYEKYCSYTGAYSPSSDNGRGANYPVYRVSWYDALVYCNKRSMEENLTPCYSIDGSTDPEEWGELPTAWDDPLRYTWDAATCNWNANGYRLPTEAEWEYAARAGDNTVDSLTYSGTSNIDELGAYAWYTDNSNNITHEVGTKKPNAFDLCDMSGNVFEWCWNWFTDRYDTTTEGGSDPTGASAGASRVCRGGASYGDDTCAVSYRSDHIPHYRSYLWDDVGFRVVRLAN